MSEESAFPTSTTDLDRVWELYDREDSMRACEFIESTGDAFAAARAYSDLVPWLYRKKQLAAMIAIGRAGIQFCLGESNRRRAMNAAEALQLAGIAKSISYNVSSNLWPGWNDEGIELTRSDLAVGLDLSRINLRLGRELNRGPEPMGNAFWLVGAHELAAGLPESSQARFDAAEKAYGEAHKPEFGLMARGYALLAGKAAQVADSDRKLRELLDRLRQFGTEDTTFFARQIETAEKVLLRSN
jgi:hypothetical protein